MANSFVVCLLSAVFARHAHMQTEACLSSVLNMYTHKATQVCYCTNACECEAAIVCAERFLCAKMNACMHVETNMCSCRDKHVCLIHTLHLMHCKSLQKKSYPKQCFQLWSWVRPYLAG